MWTRAELKEKAKYYLKRSYWGLVLMAFIASIVSSGASMGGGSSRSSSGTDSQDIEDFMDGLKQGSSSVNWNLFIGIIIAVLVIILVAMVIGFVLRIFVFNPLQVGTKRYFIEAAYMEKKVGDAGLVVYAFGHGRYGNVAKTMFLKDLYRWLWSLLFIIPGIIKGYEYRMIPYILAENPTLATDEVFDLSKQMMQGQKWNAFVLDLSFIGWILLSVCTCGLLAIFYVNPYIYMTDAALYERLKKRVSSAYYDPALSGAAYGGYVGNPYGNDPYGSGGMNYPSDQNDRW